MFDDEEPIVDRTSIRRRYQPAEDLPVPATTKSGHTFIVSRWLEHHGAHVDFAPTSKSGPLAMLSVAVGEEKLVVLSPSALQSEGALATLIHQVREIVGDLDEAVSAIEAAKDVLGVDCEEYIALLEEVKTPARRLMAKQEARVAQLQAADEAKQLSK